VHDISCARMVNCLEASKLISLPFDDIFYAPSANDSEPLTP